MTELNGKKKQGETGLFLCAWMHYEYYDWRNMSSRISGHKHNFNQRRFFSSDFM